MVTPTRGSRGGSCERSPFAPDHEHLHHDLPDNGPSRRLALALKLTLAASFVPRPVVAAVQWVRRPSAPNLVGDLSVEEHSPSETWRVARARHIERCRLVAQSRRRYHAGFPLGPVPMPARLFSRSNAIYTSEGLFPLVQP